MKAIRLPDWVYRNLLKYQNCALPNKCNEMNRDRLKAHLEQELDAKVVIRQAIFKETIKLGKVIEHPYLIAEVKHNGK